jgi:hypothetical protein
MVPANATGRAQGQNGRWYYHDAKGMVLGIAPAPNGISAVDLWDKQGDTLPVSQPWADGNSAVTLPVSQPFHDGISAVDPSGISAVTPSGISAVDPSGTSTVEPTAEIPLKIHTNLKSHYEPSEPLKPLETLEPDRFLQRHSTATLADSSAALRAAGTGSGVVASSSRSGSKALHKQEQEQHQPQSVVMDKGVVVGKPMVKYPWVNGVRPKGVVTKPTPPPLPKPPPQSNERPVGHQTKGIRPLPPNWICYPMVFVVGKNIDSHGHWLGGRLPRCKRCHGILPPQENHDCPGYIERLGGLQPMGREERSAWHEAKMLNDGDWDDDQYDRTTLADIPLVVKYGEDWDDDHYDATTHGEIDLEYRSEYEDSGTVTEHWDEDRWMAWKRQQLGYSKDYDPTLECQGEELDWEHEEYEDEDE